MEAYDYSEKAKHDQAKHRELEAIDHRLKRHENLTRFSLTLVLILAGLALVLIMVHLPDPPTTINQ